MASGRPLFIRGSNLILIFNLLWLIKHVFKNFVLNPSREFLKL